MLMASELLQRYSDLIAEPVKTATCISGECVSKLLETPWVKIMVIRYQLAPNICTIEIEVSLPLCIIEPTYPSEESTRLKAHNYIDSTIAHLNYLLKLQETGFAVGILSIEGIWSAVLKLKGNPDEKLFEILIPPKDSEYNLSLIHI